MIHGITQAYAAQQTTQIAATDSRPTTPATARTTGDTVSLSDESKLLSGFYDGLGIDCPQDGVVHLDDLEGGLEKLESALQSDIGALFVANGIKEKPPVELTTGTSGHVRVVGDHPQKDEIEALFDDNPDLANDFRRVSSLNSLVEAGKEYEEFAKAYAVDPQAAVARFGHLFDQIPDEPFSLVVGEEA